MTLTDFIFTALNNIRKNRLRSALTIAGVAVAIGALSSMMSFGIGLQKNFDTSINSNNIIKQITVTAKNKGNENTYINDSVLLELSSLKGVENAFWETRIPAKLLFQGKDRNTTIKPIPFNFNSYFSSSEFLAGTFFSSDSANELIITENILEKLLIATDTSFQSSRATSIFPKLIGSRISVSTVVFDQNIMSNMFSAFSSIMNSNLPVRDSIIDFKLVGIVKAPQMPYRTSGVYISENTAKKIPQVNFKDVWDLMNRENTQSNKAITLYASDIKDVENIQQEVVRMGYTAHSFLDNLQKMKKMFLIMDSILGAIGIMALFIATLGLINTLIMSIYERTKEIGILKSLGAKNSLIRKIFVIESGTIGFLGALTGIPLGWAITKIANVVLFNSVFKDVEEEIVIFSFPFYLIAGTILFSILFSIAAGLYPATRASRLNPVKALRHD